MKTHPVKCNLCGHVFTVLGDLPADEHGHYCLCPGCEKGPDWEQITWDEFSAGTRSATPLVDVLEKAIFEDA